jgi:hypothetical protein
MDLHTDCRVCLVTAVCMYMCVFVQVYLFGGAVCSWKQASGDEVLYVRPDAVFDKVCVESITHSGSRGRSVA